MARTGLTLTLLFLIIARAYADKPKGFLTALEENLENKLSDYATGLAKWLEEFNDKNLGHTELGRLLHYEEIKPKLEESGRRRSMKKMGMSMLPLVFHVGATSTWMVLTTIMAAKSVAIGMALLIFKIAVSSAKVASFFTSLKSKTSEHHGWAWSPHHEHHGHDRSFSGLEPLITLPEYHLPSPDVHSYSPEVHSYGPVLHSHGPDLHTHGPDLHAHGPDLQSHVPDWSASGPVHEYKTIPTSYEYSEHETSFPVISYAGDHKKRDTKHIK